MFCASSLRANMTRKTKDKTKTIEAQRRISITRSKVRQMHAHLSSSASLVPVALVTGGHSPTAARAACRSDERSTTALPRRSDRLFR